MRACSDSKRRGAAPVDNKLGWAEKPVGAPVDHERKFTKRQQKSGKKTSVSKKERRGLSCVPAAVGAERLLLLLLLEGGLNLRQTLKRFLPRVSYVVASGRSFAALAQVTSDFPEGPGAPTPRRPASGDRGAQPRAPRHGGPRSAHSQKKSPANAGLLWDRWIAASCIGRKPDAATHYSSLTLYSASITSSLPPPPPPPEGLGSAEPP